MKYLITIFIFVASQSYAAAPSSKISNGAPQCKTVAWKKPRDLPLKAFKEILDASPRADVIQMAWGEILNDSNKTVAAPLLNYLAGTENDSIRRGYYKAMNSMITGGLTPEEAVQAWPKRVMSKKSIYTLPQLCDLLQKSHEKK